MGESAGEIVKAFYGKLENRQEPDADRGDFYDSEGLLCCGKCKTRKEYVQDVSKFWPDRGKIILPVMCKCRQEEVRREKERSDFEQKMFNLRRMKDASLMDSKYREASFESYIVTEKNRKVKQLAERYMYNFSQMYEENQGIIFYGPVGSGKSYTAACIANGLLEQFTPVIMTSFIKILQNTQGFEVDEAEYLAQLNTAKLLILDDLGAERNTDYAIEKLYNVIDSRSRAAKPMILTTNLSLEDMMNCQDIRYKRIYDRIFETCYPVFVEGDSFRRIEAGRRFDRMREFLEE